MAQSPGEKTYVEIPFIEQLKGMGWDHIEGVIDVPYLTERDSFRDVLLTARLRKAIKKINLDNEGDLWIMTDEDNDIYTWYPDGVETTATPTAVFGRPHQYLSPGIVYTIKDPGGYVSGDDFSNAGDAISGTVNTDGYTFRATVHYPKDGGGAYSWENSTPGRLWHRRP